MVVNECKRLSNIYWNKISYNIKIRIEILTSWSTPLPTPFFIPKNFNNETEVISFPCVIYSFCHAFHFLESACSFIWKNLLDIDTCSSTYDSLYQLKIYLYINLTVKYWEIWSIKLSTLATVKLCSNAPM
jgi:hypothetical protein